LFIAAAEAVHHAAQTSRPPMRFQNLEEVVPCVSRPILWPAMDENGPLARGGYFKLANQSFALHRVRRALVVVVQADLAAGNDLRLSQQAVELGNNCVVDLRRIVRIDSRAGVKLRKARTAFRPSVELAANGKRPVHPRCLLANSDRQHCTHAGLIRAAQHQFAVV
jgi:hypothetical protein